MNAIKVSALPLLVISLILCFGCKDNQFLQIFQRDLTLNVIFKNHKGLIKGTPVLLTGSGKQKVRIGEVEKITRTSSGIWSFEITIDSEFKKRVSTNNDFVLYSNPFGTEHDHIMVVDLNSMHTPQPFKTGAIIKGKSYFEYSVMVARKEFDSWVENMAVLSNEFFKTLDQKINEIDIESIKKQLDELIDDIGKFSEEQRQAFEKKTLPELKKRIDQALQYFENHLDEQELQELQKRYEKIKKTIGV